MGRPQRTDTTGTWHHVVNRGAGRQAIFSDDRDRAEFERLLGVAHGRFGVNVHAYCLMSNHYHLLVECPDGGLSEAMHVVGSVFVRHVNERRGRDGPLFRDRYYAKPVGSDAYLVRLARYIHRNPLAFVPASALRAYRWSSLRAYLGDRRPPPWLRCDVLLAVVGGVDGLERLVLGDEAPSACADIESWRGAVDLMVDTHLGDRARQGASRTVTALVLDRLAGGEREQVAELLAFPNDQARRSALSRARRQARSNPALEAAAAAVLDIVA